MIDARNGYELIVGSSTDSQFGPVLLFGLGGQLVEVLKDRALGLPPLNATLARRMMEQTQIFKALGGVRGRKPVDVDLLCQILVHFSQLVIEQPWIKEIEINPLLATPDRILAADAPRGPLARGQARSRFAPLGDPPLSDAVCKPLDFAQRHGRDDPTHSPGR